MDFSSVFMLLGFIAACFFAALPGCTLTVISCQQRPSRYNRVMGLGFAICRVCSKSPISVVEWPPSKKNKDLWAGHPGVRFGRAALLSGYRYRIGWEERTTVNNASGGAFWQTPLDELERQLGASSNGLNSTEAAARLLRYGVIAEA